MFDLILEVFWSKHGLMEFSRTASGLSRYEFEASHHDLGKCQLVRGDRREVVAKGTTAQMTECDGIWARRSEADQVRVNVEWANEASTPLAPVRSGHEVDTAPLEQHRNLGGNT